jgi:hypothetical protein
VDRHLNPRHRNHLRPLRPTHHYRHHHPERPRQRPKLAGTGAEGGAEGATDDERRDARRFVSFWSKLSAVAGAGEVPEEVYEWGE